MKWNPQTTWWQVNAFCVKCLSQQNLSFWSSLKWTKVDVILSLTELNLTLLWVLKRTKSIFFIKQRTLSIVWEKQTHFFHNLDIFG